MGLEPIAFGLEVQRAVHCASVAYVLAADAVTTHARRGADVGYNTHAHCNEAAWTGSASCNCPELAMPREALEQSLRRQEQTPRQGLQIHKPRICCIDNTLCELRTEREPHRSYAFFRETSRCFE